MARFTQFPDPRDIGKPENPPVLEAHFRVKVAGIELEIKRPVQYRYVDRVYGELLRLSPWCRRLRSISPSKPRFCPTPSLAAWRFR